MNLEKIIHEAKQANREHAKEAGSAIGQALKKRNANAKKKRTQRYHAELGEITKYHEDRVTNNRSYHF